MRTTSRPHHRGAAAAVALLVLGGCAQQPGDPDAAATSLAPSSDATSPTDDPMTPDDDGPTTTDDDHVDGDFGAVDGELTGEPAGASLLTVVDVRTGEHDGYDRVVYELAGEGLPGWRVHYVDEAVEDPSGEPVDVEGDATLEVWLTGTGYPFDTGEDEFTQDVRPGAGRVLQVTRPLTFEAMTQSFVGLDQQLPFRVTLLEDPVRVVVDLQTD